MVDSGCEFYHDCETCPFPDCIADNIPSLLVAAKRAEARGMARQRMSTLEIAERLKLSKRQVERYLAT